MRHLSLALLALLSLTACGQPGAIAATAAPSGMQAQGVKAFTGDIRHHANFASKTLKPKRSVWVYLPPGYESAKAATRYPVLYMHDGNNVFDGSSAFGGHEWGADESAEKLITSGEVAPFIIVAVANTADRMSEYTWVSGLLGGDRQGGNGAAHATFMVEELKPFIDTTYRTKPDRANTAVIGSSLGGLQSLYLGRYHSDTFGKLGVMSPSVWWADRAVLKEIPQFPKNERIWLDFGHQEGKDPEVGLADARDLKRALESRGYVDGKNLSYFEDQMGGHNEQAWAYRLPMAMKYLFGTTRKAK